MNNNAQSNIKCSVENCKYYKNNYCTANNIQVANQYGNMSNSSEETVCQTFVPKDQ